MVLSGIASAGQWCCLVGGPTCLKPAGLWVPWALASHTSPRWAAGFKHGRALMSERPSASTRLLLVAVCTAHRELSFLPSLALLDRLCCTRPAVLSPWPKS